jgi:hypothetical protein
MEVIMRRSTAFARLCLFLVGAVASALIGARPAPAAGGLFEPRIKVEETASGVFSLTIDVDVPNPCYSQSGGVVAWPKDNAGVPEAYPVQLLVNPPRAGVMCIQVIHTLKFVVPELHGKGHSSAFVFVVVGGDVHPPVRVELAATK